jgi:drug/metabolite transporter (DMT)-like permease
MGEFLSILCSLFWAVSLILFRKVGFRVSPNVSNFSKNSISTILFIITVPIIGGSLLPSNATNLDIYILALSGVVGITVADSLFLYCINRIGASYASIAGAMYIPAMAVVTTLFSDTVLTSYVLIGGSLMVFAIALNTVRAKGTGFELKDLIIGSLAGIASMLIMAYSVVIIKRPVFVDYSIMEKFSAIWVTLSRLFFAVIFAAPFIFTKYIRQVKMIFSDKKIIRLLFITSFVGVYLSMFIWIAGMRYIEDLNVSSILNQFSVLFTIILARIFLQEKITKRKITAMILAIIGGVIAVL